MVKPTWLKSNKRSQVYKPVRFDLNKKADLIALQKLQRKGLIGEIVDEYEEQLEELFKIENPPISFNPDYPKALKQYISTAKKKGPLWQQGTWFYYPWREVLVHVLSHEKFWLVRTARNRNLITEAEQKKFYDAVVGVAGQSVGSSIAITLALEGGARHIKLADFDDLELSNTNRVKAGVESLGLPKVVVAARQIYEINPYAKVDIYKDGITKKNIENFFTKSGKLDVMIDEVDNLAVKYLIREKAKKHRVPIVMAADNGENGVVDIERYDLDPKTPFFHNRIGKVSYAKLAKLNKLEIGRTIGRHVGVENIPVRMIESLQQVGRTLASWPQLGGAALLNGVAVAYCVRRIVNNQSLEKNRGHVVIDEPLTPALRTKSAKRKTKKVQQGFKKALGL